MFFFPISDVNATKNKPFISWIILISCILIFINQKISGYHFEQKTILSFGMIPSVLFNIKQLSDDLKIIPAYMTLISSMFSPASTISLRIAALASSSSLIVLNAPLISSIIRFCARA